MNPSVDLDGIIEFAESRLVTQDDLADSLVGSVKYALRRYPKRGWSTTLLNRAEKALREQYHAASGRWTSARLRAAQRTLRSEIRDSLSKMGEITNAEQTTKFIAREIAADVVNLAAELAAQDDDTPDVLVKTWVSMDDERVRPTHRAAHGQTVPLGSTFVVGESRMRRPGDVTAPIGEWANCRCVLAITRDEEQVAASLSRVRDADAAPLVAAADPDTTGGVMAEDETREGDEQAFPLPEDGEEFPPAPDEPLDFSDDPVPFWGVLAPEDRESGDQRKFAAGSLRARPYPLPLAYQKVNKPGHDDSVKVGNIESAWRRDGLVFYSGHFLTVPPEADEAIGVMWESGGRMGVSVDADDGEAEMHTRDGQNVMDLMEALEPGDEVEIDFAELITVFTTARAAGATLCNIPAFPEAFTAIGDVPEEFLPQEGEELAVESRADAISAGAKTIAFAPGTEDGPGWLTHPIDTDRLRDFWVKGRGAALIGWGIPGDFNRCRMHLAKYIKPNHLSGYCANRHKDALGVWPGQEGGKNSLAASAHVPEEGETMAPAITLVASADLMKPPADWFEDPHLTGPSPIVVTEDGRVFGHLATWGTCHIGIDGVCTEPPRNTNDYAFFRTGAVLTDTGEMVPVGNITMDTGHAALNLRSAAAAAHYDNTGLATADVAAGDDDYGIWIAGCVRPDTPPEKIRALRASVLSGDWRDIGGELELVAALAVNVGGFPVPRTAIAASGGRQTALVAANIVLTASGESSGHTVEEIVAKTIEAVEARNANRAAMQALRDQQARERKAEMAALAASREN